MVYQICLMIAWEQQAFAPRLTTLRLYSFTVPRTNLILLLQIHASCEALLYDEREYLFRKIQLFTKETETIGGSHKAP